tara:strand:- start:90 stop:470 length:381 start_codon:yes stop_codon:yes gene_type:complete
MKEVENGLRAILIDPFKEKIRVAYLPQDTYIDEIKKWMEVDLIDIVTVDGSNQMILDDEGLLKSNNRFFHWAPLATAYAGKAVIVGYDKDGETTDASYHPRRVEDELVEWLPEGFTKEPYMQFVGL